MTFGKPPACSVLRPVIEREGRKGRAGARMTFSKPPARSVLRPVTKREAVN